MDTSADQLVERLVRLVTRWRLVTPAITLLEANKPLCFAGSQLLLLLQPMTDFFVARELSTDLVHLLADRSQVENLIARLEATESKE